MPTLNKGPWSKEEDKLLYEGVRLRGFKSVLPPPTRLYPSKMGSEERELSLTLSYRWALVSQMVKTRQPDRE